MIPLLMFLIVAIFSSLSFAQNRRFPEKREWKVELQNEMLRLLSKSVNFSIQDEFDFRLRLVRDSKWVISTNFNYATSSMLNRSELQFGFDLFYIVEFRVNKPDDIYVGDAATDISHWPTKQLQWNHFWNESQSENSGVLHREWTRVSSDGVLTIRIHVDQLIANGTQVKFLPNSVKYDIEINNYPWQSNSSRLALVSRVSSTTAPTSDNCTTGCIFDVNSISFNDNFGLPLGVFSWDPKVTVGKNSAPVIAYAKNSSQSLINIYFTFKTTGNPTSIIWDPLQGLNYDNPKPPLSPGLKFLIVVAVVVFVGLSSTVVFILLRNRSQGYTAIQ